MIFGAVTGTAMRSRCIALGLRIVIEAPVSTSSVMAEPFSAAPTTAMLPTSWIGADVRQAPDGGEANRPAPSKRPLSLCWISAW